MKKYRLTFTFIFVCVCALTSGKECNVVPKCTCQLGDVTLPVEEATAGTEAIAGAVGALGSSLLAGSGLGIWYYIKGRSASNAVDFGRSDTVLSGESLGGRKGSQDSHPSPSPKAPNVYRAGITRDLTGRKPAPIIQPGVDF